MIACIQFSVQTKRVSKKCEKESENSFQSTKAGAYWFVRTPAYYQYTSKDGLMDLLWAGVSNIHGLAGRKKSCWTVLTKLQVVLNKYGDQTPIMDELQTIVHTKTHNPSFAIPLNTYMHTLLLRSYTKTSNSHQVSILIYDLSMQDILENRPYILLPDVT